MLHNILLDLNLYRPDQFCDRQLWVGCAGASWPDSRAMASARGAHSAR